MSGKTPSEDILDAIESIKKLASSESKIQEKDEQIERQAEIIRTLAEKNGELLARLDSQTEKIDEVNGELNQDIEKLRKFINDSEIITSEDKEELKAKIASGVIIYKQKIANLKLEIKSLNEKIKFYDSLNLKIQSNNIDELSSDLDKYKKLYNAAKDKVTDLEKNNEILEKRIKKLEEENKPIKSIKEASETIDKLNGYFPPEERRKIEEDKLKLISQEKEIEELKTKIAEKDRKILIEEESTRQANKKHIDALKEINSLKSERDEFVGIIKILSQNSQISLESLKIFLSGIKKQGGKKFTPAEIEKILKNYK